MNNPEGRLPVLGVRAVVLAAWWSLRAVVPMLLSRLPQGAPAFALNTAPDLRILLYSLAVSLVTGIAFGLLARWPAGRLAVRAAGGAIALTGAAYLGGLV